MACIQMNCITAPCPSLCDNVAGIPPMGGNCASLPPNLRPACEATKNKLHVSAAKAQLSGINWPLIGILGGVALLMYFFIKG